MINFILNFIETAWMHRQTSLAGLVVLLFALVPSIPQAAGYPPIPLSTALPLAIGLLSAKDGNKTGLP